MVSAAIKKTPWDYWEGHGVDFKKFIVVKSMVKTCQPQVSHGTKSLTGLPSKQLISLQRPNLCPKRSDFIEAPQ